MSNEENPSAPNRIMVYLRIRPPRRGEIDPANGTTELMDVQPDKKSVVLESKAYSYDHVFHGPHVEQEEIFDVVARPVVSNVFEGYWGTVMVYGQTGTGKSFTMCNFDERQQGIIPRTVRYIFTRVAEESATRTYTIKFSFIQIYLDKLQDLFNPEAAELKINRDGSGVTFPGVVDHVVRDEEHFLKLYESGNQYRVVTATKMNPESSRGHAALFLQIQSIPKDDPSGEIRSGKLFLIDLAGYERFGKTGVQEGLMAQEAKAINASLLALGNVVQALSDRSEHIPWRNAKLTRMLEDAIGGKAKCSVILTAGPSSEHLHETLGTLYFGTRAMSVKTNAKLAVNVDYKKLAAKLQDLLSQAENKISTLEVEATRRKLEREEAEARFQSEWARVKRRQEEQLQGLLATGATREKIQELINANQQEVDLLEEQHYQERQVLEERHEEEVLKELENQRAQMTQSSEESSMGYDRKLQELQRQLTAERAESQRFRDKAKEAEAEARRLTLEINEMRMTVAGGGSLDATTSLDARREMNERIDSIRQMLEENMQIRIQEVEDPLREALAALQKKYDVLQSRCESDLVAMRDKMAAANEAELAEVRRTSHDVQERLKNNHLTIKKSYQKQKEDLSEENATLASHVDILMRQLKAVGATIPHLPPARPSAPSSDVSLQESPKRVQLLEQQLKTLQGEMAYLMEEKEGLSRQLKATVEDDAGRMKPHQIRRLRADYETAMSRLQAAEAELFTLRSQQALSGPQVMQRDPEQELNEDLHGDVGGMAAFTQRILRVPYFIGAQAIDTRYAAVLGSLTNDLDEYRRMLRYRLVFMGDGGSGKSSVLKCLTAASTPMIRSLPDVGPSAHPTVTSTTVDDARASKTDWFNRYVQFSDDEGPAERRSLFGRLVGASAQDMAKFYVDCVDMPGEAEFSRGLPAMLLPGKGSVYVVMYDLTLPVDVACLSIEKNLALLQAACVKRYPSLVGGETPHVAFALVGTHRDMMRDSRDAAVLAHLNLVTIAVGEAIHALRGNDTFGLVGLGNYAVSAKDWSVLSAKGERGPKSPRDLLTHLVVTLSSLCTNWPTNFLPLTRDTASATTYMLGDDVIGTISREQTTLLDSAQRRLRQGIVTLLSALYREQKVRWAMAEIAFRDMIAEHLNLTPTTSTRDRDTLNFVERECVARGLVAVLPVALVEPKYLPGGVCGGETRPKGLVVLDPSRLMTLVSVLLAPTTIAKYPAALPMLRDKQTLHFDATALTPFGDGLSRGIVSGGAAGVIFEKILPMTYNEMPLMMELYSVLGLAVCYRAEAAMMVPALFRRPMPDVVTEYVAYLVGLYGDGVGRKYSLTTAAGAIFTRLQHQLVPFAYAPTQDASATALNWSDGALLVAEKSRLKWGIFASPSLKEAVTQAAGVPMRGIVKVEGPHLYVAIACQRPANLPDDGIVDDVGVKKSSAVLDAIHYELYALCSREFRGVQVRFQDMQLQGSTRKRMSRREGVETVLSRAEGVRPEDIATQLRITDDIANSPSVIEAAVLALPVELR